MKLAIGIILLLVASWFLYGTIRMWPPGRYRPRMLWPSTRADILRGVLLIVATCGTGVALIRGASWWWLLVAGIAIIAGSMIEGVLQRRRSETQASKRAMRNIPSLIKQTSMNKPRAARKEWEQAGLKYSGFNDKEQAEYWIVSQQYDEFWEANPQYHEQIMDCLKKWGMYLEDGLSPMEAQNRILEWLNQYSETFLDKDIEEEH
jgi:hypothetical protein